MLQAGEDTFTTKMSGERVAKDLLATYRSMVTSNAVLEEAAAKLPADARIDLRQVKRADWVETARSRQRNARPPRHEHP